MKARCISYTGDRATVVVMPSWIGWLFGYRTVAVDLERMRIAELPGGRIQYGEWLAPASGRTLRDLEIYREIRDALDFREVGSEPRRARAFIGGTVAP